MDEQKTIIQTELAPAAVGTYSQGVEHQGVYYFSGQIGLDPKSGELKTSFQAQIDQVLKNIDGLLKSCLITRGHIIKTSIFLTDLTQFELVNEAYSQYFQAPYPARSCVEVSKLPKNALVEIEVIAVKG